MIDPTDKAFPCFSSYGQVNVAAGGLTKREYFAALAMQGLLAADMRGAIDEKLPSAVIAMLAIEQADDLIHALNREGQADG